MILELIIFIFIPESRLRLCVDLCINGKEGKKERNVAK
jgi:hypothetical protein